MRTIARTSLLSFVFMVALFGLFTMGANPAIAGSCVGSPPNATCYVGIIQAYADPSDAVISTDTKGPCGSVFFNHHRTSINFKEVMAVFLTSFSTSRVVWLQVNRCEGDRNITDRAAVAP